MKAVLLAFVGLVAVLIVGVIAIVAMWGSTYNRLVKDNEQVNASWGQVQNVYQRRADLIPNIVASVTGAAAHEKDTLEGVVQARAAVHTAQMDPVKPGTALTPETLASNADAQKQYLQAQQRLGAAVTRLQVVVERYPDLKANQNFRDLNVELEGTENRIAVERKNNQAAIEQYNRDVNGFLSGFVASHYHFGPKPYFEAAAGASTAPTVRF